MIEKTRNDNPNTLGTLSTQDEGRRQTKAKNKYTPPNKKSKQITKQKQNKTQYRKLKR